MATLDFSSYTALKASIAKELNRADLDDAIPGFIQLAEAEIARRLRQTTITKSIQIASATTTLPADCAELRSVRLVTSSGTLDVALRNGTPEMLADVAANYGGVAGRPIAFTVVGNDLVVAPAPDDTYTVELRYFEALVPLSATVAMNSVLAVAPDLYFYGALMHSAPYLEHDERITTWTNYFERALVQLAEARDRQETAASLRPVKIRAFG